MIAEIQRLAGGTVVALDGKHTIDLGPVESIPIGEGRAYRIEGRTIAVFRSTDGRLHALDNRCPHQAGPLADGIVESDTVTCPMHGWKFELSSGRCSSAATWVRRYSVLAVGGRISLALGESG